MKEQTELRAAKLELSGGRVKIGSVPNGGGSDEARSNWGCLYAVSYGVGCHSTADKLLDRVEGVAQETYLRSPGGITNRLRQAIRNANRYLYLRNCVRGEEDAVHAALACVAVRGGDAYACGVGPHSILAIGRGRVRGLGTASSPDAEAIDSDCEGNGHLLGRGAKVSDPRFSYRQIVPGEHLLIVAGDEDGRFKWAAEELRDFLEQQDLAMAVKGLGEMLRQHTDGAALLIRLEENGVRPGLPDEDTDRAPTDGQSLAAQFMRSLHRKRKKIDPGEAERATAEAVEHETMEASRMHVAETGLNPSRAKSRVLSKDLPRVGAGGDGMARILESSAHLCRLGAALLVSLLLVARGATLNVVASLTTSTRRAWSWIKRNRLLERLGRGTVLALISLLAGLKGLLVGILPERQRSTSTYAATARPMARAKVLRLHPSGRSRLLIGVMIVLVVVALIGASAMRVRARLQQAEVEQLAEQIAARLAVADGEQDLALGVTALTEAQDLLGQATASQRESPELTQLSRELEARFDGLTGVVRLNFSRELEYAAPEQMASRLLVRGSYLYVLEANGQALIRYELDAGGHVRGDEEPWTWEPPQTVEGEGDSRILDIEWVEAASGRTTSAVVMLMSDGQVREVGSDDTVREVVVAGVDAWQSPRAIATYEGNLYVLDTGYRNILKYVPQGDDYRDPPLEYIQESVDINWPQVVDLAIDGYVYLLLSDGSVVKFAGGQVQPFAQEALRPPATSARTMFAAPESQTVIVAEPEAGRLAEFTAEGRLVRQYRAAADGENHLAQLGAFTVDTGNGRLIVGTTSGLFSAQLPGLRQDGLD
jgi:hypothetical protein